MAVQVNGGKVLFAPSGKIAMDPDCCCGGMVCEDSACRGTYGMTIYLDFSGVSNDTNRVTPAFRNSPAWTALATYLNDSTFELTMTCWDASLWIDNPVSGYESDFPAIHFQIFWRPATNTLELKVIIYNTGGSTTRYWVTEGSISVTLPDDCGSERLFEDLIDTTMYGGTITVLDWANATAEKTG